MNNSMSMKKSFLIWAVLSVACFLLAASAVLTQERGHLLTLDEAVETALQQNSSLLAAQAVHAASGYRVRNAGLDLLPKADLLFNYVRLDAGTVRRGNIFVDVGRTLVENFNAGDPDDIRPNAYENNFSTALQVVQPIYNGGASWAAISLARAEKDITGHFLDNTRQDVVLNVKRRYLLALQAQELVALSRKSLETSRAHLGSSRNMLEVGMRNRTDVLRWEVQTANSEGKVAEAENNLKLALASLKQVVGISFDEALALSPVLGEPQPLQATLEEQIDRSKSLHPQVKAASASVAAGRSGVRLAWAAFQPKLNFVYQLGWEKNSTLALDSFSFWNAGVSLQMPIFHSFSNVSRLQESKAELRRLQETAGESEQLLTLDLIRARLQVETAIKKYYIAQKAVELATENLRVLDKTFEVGLAANIDVLDGQEVLTESEAQLIRVRYDYWIAMAELGKAMGTLRD